MNHVLIILYNCRYYLSVCVETIFIKKKKTNSVIATNERSACDTKIIQRSLFNVYNLLGSHLFKVPDSANYIEMDFPLIYQ